MKRAVAIAKGDVQSVGYRDIIKKTARRLGVTGQVRNLIPHDVEIIAEADEEVLTRFIDAIKWETGTGEYDYFAIIRGIWQDELFERMDLAGRMMYESVSISREMLVKQDQTVALSKESVSIGREMLVKQDQTVALSKESVSIGRETLEKQDQMLVRQDQMLVKQDQTVDEIHSLRKDTKPYMDDKFGIIEKKLHNIGKVSYNF